MDILFSSAIIAVLISTIIGGLFNVVLSNKLKRNLDINTFRYTKIYELNFEVYSLPSMNYDLSDEKKLVNQSTERFHKVHDLYNKARPLLESRHRQNSDIALLEAEKLSNGIVDWVYSKEKTKVEGVPLKELLLKRQEFEKHVQESFSKTLASMLI